MIVPRKKSGIDRSSWRINTWSHAIFLLSGVGYQWERAQSLFVKVLDLKRGFILTSDPTVKLEREKQGENPPFRRLMMLYDDSFEALFKTLNKA